MLLPIKIMTFLPTFSTLILAGGKSTRMGQDKAFIPVHNTPLLKRVCEVALAVSDSVFVVTPRAEHYQPLIPANCQILNEIQPSKGETQGPLIGFWQGWQQIQSDWVLVLACDLPNLNSEILQKWSQDLTTIPEQYIAYLPKGMKDWESLCGFYHQRGKSSLEFYIQGGNRSFQGWLNQNPVLEIKVPETERPILLNCNTPEDLLNIH